MSTYLQKINEKTKTRMWVNNPTPDEAKLGLEAGCYGATSNPTYVGNMLKKPSMEATVIKTIDSHLKDSKDDHMVLSLTYQDLVKTLADIYMPLFEKTNGEQGWVAIQGNPYHDDDIDFILDEAHRYFSISPNIIVKLSATISGIAAMEKLTSEGLCALGTAGVSNYYVCQMIEAYQRGCRKHKGPNPKMFVTSLSAPFEGYAKKYVACHNINIDPKLVEASGIEMTKKMYEIWEAKYSDSNAYLIGGGVRQGRHFTELVDGDLHVTSGWSIIDELNKSDPPIEDRVHQRLSEEERNELFDKIPAFKGAYLEDGIDAADLSTFPPFLMFRNNFLTSWDSVLSVIRERRLLMK